MKASFIISRFPTQRLCRAEAAACICFTPEPSLSLSIERLSDSKPAAHAGVRNRPRHQFRARCTLALPHAARARGGAAAASGSSC